MMKKTVLFLLFFISIPSFSQEDAWVYFTNKPNAQYFLDNPLQMLTSRALLRRSNQNIPLTLNDVPVHQPYIDQVDAIPGIVVMAKSKWLNCVHVRGALSDIQSLSSLSFVSSIYYANLSLNSRISTPVSESLFSKKLETEITYSYGNSANQILMLNGHLLHQSDFVGTGKMIAVLDSGFLNANTILPLQNLYTNNLVLGGYNYVSGSADVYALDSHGTMVLSCMGGKVDGQLIGTAPNAQYYLFVTEDVVNENPVEESYWVEAAEEADRLGVDIITSSLGYFGYDNLNYSYSYSDMTGNKAFASKGANIAFSKGMIVVASAGNSGASTTAPHIRVPAEATHVLAVGAVQPDENYATFSSIGPSFDNRVKPDVMAQGQSVVLSNTSGQIVSGNGTSFSCPIMAGTIASFWQAVPSLTNQQVIDFIKQSADKYSNPNSQYGYGIPDFQLALNNVLLYINSLQKEFKVYPNPASDAFFVHYNASHLQLKIAVYNGLGQLVMEKNGYVSDEEIALSGLQSGIYYYTIASNTSFQSGLLLKK